MGLVLDTHAGKPHVVFALQTPPKTRHEVAERPSFVVLLVAKGTALESIHGAGFCEVVLDFLRLAPLVRAALRAVLLDITAYTTDVKEER